MGQKNCLNPGDFFSASCEDGKKYESKARIVYKNLNKNFQVIETGLIVSLTNPCSPDGVIMENNVPKKGLEIKCPVIGKSTGIKETVQNSCKNKCLEQVFADKSILLKKKTYILWPSATWNGIVKFGVYGFCYLFFF